MAFFFTPAAGARAAVIFWKKRDEWAGVFFGCGCCG
jgi:hypothetical protein